MRLPRVQFTVGRLMVTIAVLGISFGLVLEANRIWRRWRFCQERAALFDERAIDTGLVWKRESALLARTEAFIRRLKDLGPTPRRVSWLIASSVDGDEDRWCSKFLGRYVYGVEGDRNLLDRLEGLNREVPRLETDHSLSPTDVAQWVESYAVDGLRGSVQRRAGWAKEYDLMARAYWRAAPRPWEPLPSETIRP